MAYAINPLTWFLRNGILMLAFMGLMIIPDMLCGQMLKPMPSVTTHGKLFRIDSFPSRYVDPRAVFVWLPSDFSPQRHYHVLYMHDGQMLFDSTTTWTGQEWKVDETMEKLTKAGTIKDVIVVGISNNGYYRWSEYVPKGAVDLIPDSLRTKVIEKWLQGQMLSDAYLRFIVYELKPYIDQVYPTIPQPEGTHIMGSSMGGIISLYAICEYPQVFGSAACMSTHWPLNVPGLEDGMDHDFASYFLQYLQSHLPAPSWHRIYFDFGTATLDSLYEPYQQKVDQLMQQKGYTADQWITRKFPGEEHTESAWARRLEIPLKFLLGKG